MKTSVIGQATDVVSNLETVKMSIDASAVDHLMSNLTNLYSDPITAVLREYTSNAFDSHVRAGVNTPIEVTVPHAGSNLLIIRDFGVGMSKDEIANVYSRYGLSTKTGNNDEIGGFGLGCKSALAITDRFDIVSVKDGVKTTAYIQKNVKGVGVVHFVSEEETVELNGVEVIIPIDSRQVYRLSETMIPSFFLAASKNSIKVNGKVIPTVNDEPWVELTVGGEKIGSLYYGSYSYGSAAWNYKNISINVGGVIYNLDNFAGKNSAYDNFRNKSHRLRLVLDAPIGSVDLVPSRESIMDTERSNETISALIVDAESAVKDFFETKIMEQENFAQAVAFFNNALSLGFWESSLKYKGVEITRSIRPSSPTAAAMKFTRTNRIKAKTSNVERVSLFSTSDMFNEDGNTVLIKCDTYKWAEQVDLLRLNLSYYQQSQGKDGSVLAYAYNEDYFNESEILQQAHAHNGVDFSEVIEKALQFKSESRKALLAANKIARANGITPVKQGVTLPVYVVGDEGRQVKPVSVESLTHMKVAYIHQNKTSWKLSIIFPTLGYYYENGGAKIYDESKKVLPLINEALSGYAVVFLKHNRNVEKFLELVPHAQSAEAIISEYVAKESIRLQPQLVSFAVKAGTYSTHAASSFRNISTIVSHLQEKKMLDEVTSECASRVFKAALQGLDEQENIINILAYWGIENENIENEVKDFIKDIKLFSETYPLVESVNNFEGKTLNHIVKYVNMV